MNLSAKARKADLTSERKGETYIWESAHESRQRVPVKPGTSGVEGAIAQRGSGGHRALSILHRAKICERL